MYEKFIAAYESYLQSATEQTWAAATRAAKEYAKLADKDVDMVMNGNVSRLMAVVAQRQKPGFFRRLGIAYDRSRGARYAKPQNSSPREILDRASFGEVDAELEAAVPAQKSKSQTAAEVLRALRPGDAVVIAFDSRNESDGFQTLMPSVERILGWKRGADGAAPYSCKSIAQKAVYVNGNVKPVYLLRVGRIS